MAQNNTNPFQETYNNQVWVGRGLHRRPCPVANTESARAVSMPSQVIAVPIAYDIRLLPRLDQ